VGHFFLVIILKVYFFAKSEQSAKKLMMVITVNMLAHIGISMRHFSFSCVIDTNPPDKVIPAIDYHKLSIAF
jgi:hypothetical protein